MASLSKLPFEARAGKHRNAVARKLFNIALEKKSNVVVSADVATAKELLDLAELLGPYMVVLKTHIDIVSDLSTHTLTQLKAFAAKHNFLLFEDRKFVDIGNTVQKQYHGGALRISEWAHIVNCSVLAGPGIVDALAQTAATPEFRAQHAPQNNGDDDSDNGRALLILAEMTSSGSLATGEYTKLSVDLARQYPEFVLGFVSTRSLGDVDTQSVPAEDEDFIVFTTGVNLASTADALGQQYQTPESAVMRGADFIISGRGIYAAADPVRAIKQYQEQGWQAYLRRVGMA